MSISVQPNFLMLAEAYPVPASRRLRRRMKLAVSPIPPKAQALTAYLIVKNAGDAIQF